MKEVVILGMGESRADYDPSDPAEVWGMNFVYRHVKKLDRLFFFDDVSHFGLESLKKLKYPIVSKAIIPGLDNEVYPLEEIIAGLGERYFANTFCYMFAYALWKKYDRIRTYGVDMISHREKARELPAMNFWVGFARGRGVDVRISAGSEVYPKIPLYGYKGGRKMPSATRTAGTEQKPVTFLSHHKELVVMMNGSPIEFHSGVYTTADPRIIDYLRSPRHKNSLIEATHTIQKALEKTG